jgi:hypothetical protein
LEKSAKIRGLADSGRRFVPALALHYARATVQ